MMGGPYSQGQVLQQVVMTCPRCQIPMQIQAVDYVGIYQRDKTQAGQHGYNVSALCTCGIRSVKQVLLA